MQQQKKKTLRPKGYEKKGNDDGGVIANRRSHEDELREENVNKFLNEWKVRVHREFSIINNNHYFGGV